jgi:hypothetical protein
MSERVRLTVYLDSGLAEEVKEAAFLESRSVANYLEVVLLGSEQLEADLQDIRRRKESARP